MAVKAIVGKTSTFVLSFAPPAFSNVAYGKNLGTLFLRGVRRNDFSGVKETARLHDALTLSSVVIR